MNIQNIYTNILERRAIYIHVIVREKNSSPPTKMTSTTSLEDRNCYFNKSLFYFKQKLYNFDININKNYLKQNKEFFRKNSKISIKCFFIKFYSFNVKFNNIISLMKFFSYH